MHQNFFHNLSPHDAVLTVNQRLAAYLRGEYDNFQKSKLDLLDLRKTMRYKAKIRAKAEHTDEYVSISNEFLTPQCAFSVSPDRAWPSIDILPFTAWLRRCWQNALLTGDAKPYMLLSSQQEQALWEQIIQTSAQRNGLLCLSATAQAAKQAWQLTKQWQVNFQLPIFKQAEDSRSWQAWARTFEELCETNHWLDNASLVEECEQLAKTKQLVLPSRIFLLGFDEVNPQYQQLFSTLEKVGCEVIKDSLFATVALRQSSGHLPQGERFQLVIPLENNEAELYAMAEWARASLQKGIQRIGCVIPNLNHIRAQVSEIFTEVFAPYSLLPGRHTADLPFNISAGVALTDFSLIACALQLLRLKNTININDLTALLRSPYWGGANTEMSARMQLDVALRKQGETQLLLHSVMVAAQQRSCPLLAKLLKDFIANKPNTKSFAQSPSQWAANFVQQLNLFNWPGERVLDSTEYQLFQRWHALLTEFSQLDLVLPSIDRITALQQLQQLAHSTLFQPQTVHHTPIQILGVLESAGLHFDQTWVMGLHDQAWPESPKPNAFIPIELQRKLKMPHASSERELQFCQTVTTRLQQSAPQVIFSYPQHDADRQLQVSPLLQNLPSTTLNELSLDRHLSFAEQLQLEASLETFEDEYGPALTDTEIVSHSTSIFKSQAACPFRAFAQFRLGAVAIESPVLGIDARTRGNLLHSALEILWNQIGNHTQLMTYTQDELDTVINTSIDNTLTFFIKKRPLTFKKQFTQLEKQRLYQLLQKWLELEKQRPPFTVIAMEQSGEYKLANMPLKLRVDRIDQLADGNHLIIDYKTSSNVSPNNWLGERPEEPQLPIYCVTSTLPISGILFAQLRSNHLQFSGISASKINIDGVIPVTELKEEIAATTWTELIHHWQSVLEELARQFQNGYAKVDPKYNKSTCEHCDLGILCRVRA